MIYGFKTIWEIASIGISSPLMYCGDIDKDNDVEILIPDVYGTLIAISGYSGKIKSRINVSNTNKINDIAVRDINNDGTNEIIIAVDHEGIIIHNYLSDIQHRIILPSSPIRLFFADIDRDGEDEIFSANIESAIDIVKKNKVINRIYCNNPIYAVTFDDINSDGILELIIYHDLTISIFHCHEELQLLDELKMPFHPLAVSFKDIDSNKKKELIVLLDGKLMIFPDFPNLNYQKIDLFPKKITSFALSDINLDNMYEYVLLCTDINQKSFLCIVNASGRLTYSRELHFVGLKIFTTDIDGDNRDEICIIDASGTKIHCLDLAKGGWYSADVGSSILALRSIDLNADGQKEIIVKTSQKIIAMALRE